MEEEHLEVEATEVYLWLVAGLKVTGRNKLKTLLKSDFVIKSKHAYKMNKLYTFMSLSYIV